VVLIVSRRQPVANDLRTVFAAGQIAQSLERIGDLSANIAKRSLALTRYSGLAPALNVGLFARSVRRTLTLALQAFAEEDRDLALEVWKGDADIDRHHTSLFQETLAAMQADRENVVPGAHLLFVLKNLERIGDYATAIAESCHFTVAGAYPQGERPKADSTSQWTPGQAP
jgi:phosphate transport system protein